MITIACDDVLSIAQQIREMVEEIDPYGTHHACSDVEELFSLAGKTKPDIVWLDIEMPGASGLEASAEIKKVSPDTNIVFVTAYTDYAIDAFKMHAGGYVLKPVSEQRLRDEIDNIRRSSGKKEEHNSGLLRIQCFGNFEVFGKNGIVRFSRSLSKEALAYLVDRRGAGCTVGEICSVLWEDRTADKALKSQCRVILGSLKKDLEQAGAAGVIVKYWNTWGIDTDKVECDYYAFLRKDSTAVNSFRGEYMAQYSWAEMTVGRLYNITQDETV